MDTMRRDDAFPQPADDGDPSARSMSQPADISLAQSQQAFVPALPPVPRWFHSRCEAYSMAQEEAELLARDDRLPVLITGETGTGKSYFAQHIHDCSPRRDGEFVALALAGIHDETAASALRGHVRGAFTGAERSREGALVSARGGTLFLDEVGKASPQVQRMLLQIIEDRAITPLGADRPVPVNVRLVLAANEPLEELMQRGAFLKDLYYRVANAAIDVPPVRERVEDIPILAAEIAAYHAARLGHGQPLFDPIAMRALQNARWEGNVRQMDGVIHAMVLKAGGTRCITLDHRLRTQNWLVGGLLCPETRRSRLNPVTREQAELALQQSGGNRGKAAQLLNVSRQTLHVALKRPRNDRT
jgi:DNA-binding NtrC family response regulator